MAGSAALTVGEAAHELSPGSYAYLPPGQPWTLHATGDEPSTFHWVRKAYEVVDGVDAPEAFVTHESDVRPQPMPGTPRALPSRPRRLRPIRTAAPSR